MSVLPNLRNTATAGQPFPYIDTPDFAYDQWLSGLGQSPIGSASGTVAVIGGGVSGLCAAYELKRAGCSVSVFEQAAQVGGRCASDKFPNDPNDIAEMGSMRFPPSEFILNWYLTNFGLIPGTISDLPPFPDPGVVPTYICYGGQPPQVWSKATSPAPNGFETVYKGWIALVTQPLQPTGSQPALLSAEQITALLRQGNIDAASTAWQAYLNVFGQQTFYSALYSIFTGNSGYAIPGGTAWSFEDFDKFGALGIGSGGFGPLYPIGFCEILRIVIDGLEDLQRFLQPNSFLTDGIRTLSETFASNLGSVSMGTSLPITGITGNIQSGFTLTGPGQTYGPFSRVIVATTTRSMELTLGLTEYGANAYVSPPVAQSIMRTHVVSSNKVAALIPNFWANNPTAVRCLQTDGTAHQVYTLDYTAYGSSTPDPNGVCFMSYVWDDDAVKQQSITDGAPSGSGGATLYQFLSSSLQSIGAPVAGWVQQNLQPLNGNFQGNVLFEEWQSTTYFAGAFKLSEPGQDPYVQVMFFDYQKAGGSNNSGVYIAGDHIAWTSGWVEGGLTTGLNAAAAVIKSLGGTLNTDANGRTPMTINAGRYTYWGPVQLLGK